MEEKIRTELNSELSKKTISHENLENVEEIKNEYYKNDVSHTLQYSRWLLSILGVWQIVKKNPSKIEIFSSPILVIVCMLFLLFDFVPWTLNLMFVETNSAVKLKIIPPTGFLLTSILKYGAFFLRRKMIKNCMDHVEIDWKLIERENEREIMIRNVNVGRHLTLFSAGFLYTGGLSYHAFVPLLQGSSMNEFNVTIRPLVYPGYDMFVDSQASPNYEIIFLANCISSCVAYTITTAACNSAAIFVGHACGQIEIMMSRLETIFDNIDETSEIIEKRIGFVIKLHVRMLKFTSMIENLLREICLVEVVASTLIICLLEYDCLMEWSKSDTVAVITILILIVSLSFNMFIFCHIGELLKEQCCQIGKAAYMIDWYKLPGKTGLVLIMIIAMANRPRQLTAGRMIELSILSFGSIIKTTVVYLNMLRTMAD